MEQQHSESKPAESKPTERKDSDRFWKITTVVLIAILAVLAFRGGGNIGSGDGATGQVIGAPAPTAAAPSAPTAPSGPPLDMKALVDDDEVLGDKNAPVTIVEWSDFECPFCSRFHEQTWPELKKTYIDTGKVKFVYRDFPLSFHANAQPAAEAAECAGDQAKYWQMHEKLFVDGVEGGAATFKQYATDLGLDSAKFNKCLDTGEKRGEVQKDMADGSRAGIQGTPGFVINGELVSGAQPFQVFQQIIESKLSQ